MAPDYSDLANVLNGVYAVLRRSGQRSFAVVFAHGAIGKRKLTPADDVANFLETIVVGMTPRAIAATYRALLRSRATSRPKESLFAWHSPDDRCRWFSLRVVAQTENDGVDQWSALLLDVSALKEAEKAAADRSGEFDTLFRNAPENIVRYDAEGRIVDINATLERTLGLSLEDVKGRRSDELTPHDQFAPIVAAVQRVLETGERQDVEAPLELHDGKLEYHVISFVAERDSDGAITGVLAFGRNVVDLQAVQKALAESQDLLHAAVKTFPDMVWLKDISGRYILCNDRFEAFNNSSEGALIGKCAEDTREGLRTNVHLETDLQALQSKETVQFCMGVPRAEGFAPSFFDVRKTAVRNRNGEIVGILGTARDVTEKLRLEEEVRTRERAYRSLAEHLPDCLARYDSVGRRIYANRAMEQMFHENFTGSDQGPMRLAFPIPGVSEHYLPISELARQVFASGKPICVERRVKGRSGRVSVHEVRLVPEFDASGCVETVLSIGRDITEAKNVEYELREKERELAALAYTDGLTGLANRVAFYEKLSRRLNDVLAGEGKLALLTLDIDRFKSVNDTLGHARGDELLVEFSRRLVDAVGSKALVARLGGDEFVVALSYVAGSAGALSIADAIAKNVARPMIIGGNPIHVTISIGIAIGPDDGSTEAELLRYSDIALYSAKMAGRSRASCFSKELREKIERRFEIEAMMNDALDQGHFFAHFQPKVDLGSGKITGAEALCRWRHPTLGMVSPAEFIPVAEETGQIIAIGKIMLMDACRFAVICNEGRPRPLLIAVNLSARQLLFGGLLGTFGACLEQTGCKAHWIELEITESILLAGDKAVSETLETLTRLGARVTIDDFGTGYSSLSYLGRLPISTLKIDQSFVRGMATDHKQEVLVRAIIAMAQGLGLETVAEGVETMETAEKLRAIGCDIGQGFLWGCPEPAEALLEMLSAPPRRVSSAR